MMHGDVHSPLRIVKAEFPAELVYVYTTCGDGTPPDLELRFLHDSTHIIYAEARAVTSWSSGYRAGVP